MSRSPETACAAATGETLSMGEVAASPEVISLQLVCQMHRHSQSATEIALDQFAPDAAPQEVRPLELTNGASSLAYPPALLSAPASERKGSSCMLSMVSGMSGSNTAVPHRQMDEPSFAFQDLSRIRLN